MRLLVQRVKNAFVEVNSKKVGSISDGLLVFFASHKEDKIDQTKILAEKVVNFRIFLDDDEKMNLSLLDLNLEILIVSQFTLYANTKKGRRPSFIELMEPNKAKKIYEQFIKDVKKIISKVETGVFGAKMKVHLINDGPLTFIIDTDF